MKALIIEDERRAGSRLSKMIEAYDPGIEVLGRIDSVKSSVSWFNSNPPPDLIFMDIQLADGLCFDIFQETQVKSPVIFTTAYDEYALKAFKVNSIDYLLKPICFKEFKAGMDKFQTLKNSSAQNKNNAVSAGTMISKSYKSRFVVKLGDHIHPIRVEDICCFLSKDKTTYIHTNDSKKYIVDYTLEQIEHLVCPNSFYRVNRKCIIRMESICDIIFYSNSRLKIVMNNFKEPEEVIVSREKVQDFRDWLDR